MININLVPENLRKRRKTPLFSVNALNLPKEAIVGMLGGLLVLLFAIHFLLQMVIFTRFIQHARAKKQWERILPEKQKVDVVINELRSLQNKLSSIDKITNEKKILWAQKLNALSDVVPRGIWFNKLTLDDRLLIIDGSAVSKTRDEMVSVGNFTSSLKADTNFMAGLNNLELGSIQRRQLKALDLVDFVITAKLQ